MDKPHSDRNERAADKVAVIVIHGMGEQKPMETLRGFVRTVWERDQRLVLGITPPAEPSELGHVEQAGSIVGLRRVAEDYDREGARSATPGRKRNQG